MTSASGYSTVLAQIVASDDRTHREIVAGFNDLARSSNIDATLSIRTLHRWMAGNLTTKPRAAARRVAMRYWGAPIDDLLAPPRAETGDVVLAPRTHAARSQIEPWRRATLGSAPAPSMWIASELEADPAVVASALARRALDHTLGSGTVIAARVDQIEESADAHRADYVREAPLTMLNQLLLDLDDVRALAEHRQPGMVQIRLSKISAELAVLVADSLMKLGMITEARAWYRTARLAADDTPDTELRARIRAQEAMLPYYYGDPAASVRLTREARHLAGSDHSPATALAVAAEARALARLGRRDDAFAALKTAQNIFERIEARGDDALLDFPEKRFLLYLSGTLTYLQQTRDARRIQDRALSLYTEAFVIDPALLLLDRAICAVLEHNAEEACLTATDAVLSVPEAHRTAILRTRAHNVLTHLPAEQQRGSLAEQLREVIAGILPRR